MLDLTLQTYGDFRSEIRQAAFEVGVTSNPASSNEEILNRLRARSKGEPLESSERFVHGDCDSYRDEFQQLRDGVVATAEFIAQGSDAKFTRPEEDASLLTVLEELRHSLKLSHRSALLRGVNTPHTKTWHHIEMDGSAV